ncbi:MAG TPA: hypothetical protein VFU40_08750, partial [Gemmatimonadales bacterium]|nr:hypothetical protein [Gemmatimonadales bacterium]
MPPAARAIPGSTGRSRREFDLAGPERGADLRLHGFDQRPESGAVEVEVEDERTARRASLGCEQGDQG